ncbi:MAG: sodium:solute symporter family protein [Desulfobacterales bacterium]|nr:sodium:solute symporter family protein [Desulfobacterales bacterium]
MTFNPDVAVILVYLLVLLGVGYWSSRRINDSKDYIIAGGRISFPVLLGTLIGTSIGAASTMGKAGKAYEIGIGLFFATMAYAVGLILFGFMSPVLRRIKVWNIPDALFLRYGNGVRMTFAVILVFSVTALFGTQLIAVGLAITSIMGSYGITYTEAIVFAGVIMVLYTMMGGLLAVAYTDVIQMVIMIAAIGILLPVFVVYDVGGMAAASYLKPPPGNFWGGLTPAYIVSMVLIDLPFCLIDPSLWQRAAAADSAGSIKKGMFVTGGVYIFWSLNVVFLGIAASHILPGLPNMPTGGDNAIPGLILHYMPVGLRGLCLAAMMAVMMSTADTVLLIAGSTFSRDIVRPFRPNISDQSELFIARMFILVIGVFGLVFALMMTGLFDLMLLAFAIFVSGGFVPVMAALFWTKATKQGAIVSSAGAFITVVSLYGMKEAHILPIWIEPIIAAMVISLILMVMVSLATYRPETATIRLMDRNLEPEL